MPVPDNSRAGFTLLEALIAMTILAAATTSLMVLIGMNRWAEAQAEADLSAALNARTLLNRIGRDLPLEIGNQTGTFENGEGWSVRVSPYHLGDAKDNDQGQHLLQVRVHIKQSRPRSATMEIVTLREVPR